VPGAPDYGTLPRMSRLFTRIAGLTAALAMLLPAATAAAADPFPLNAWYPLNEGTGQVVHDRSGHHVDGYLGSTPDVDANDPSWIRGVFLGSALSFSGDDMVTIPDSPYLEPTNLTVSVWFRSTSSPGTFRYVVSKGGTKCSGGAWGLYTGKTGGMGFYILDHKFSPDGNKAAVSPLAPATVWDGKWHNAAGTYDGATVRLFIDGTEVGSGTPTTEQIDYDTVEGDGAIGQYVGTCNLALIGDVDGVQVWSKALQVDKIWAILRPLVTASR
jgi:Concanavalin A-like lectin/glucanases superfamily